MEAYIFLLIIVFLLGVLSIPKEKRGYFYVLAFVIFSFIAFRDDSVGPDTYKYVRYFLQPRLGYEGDSRPFELFFEFWNVALRSVWKEGNFFIFINSFVCLGSIFFVIKKDAERKVPALIALLCLFNVFNMYLTLFRQCLAVSFFVFAIYQYLHDKKKISYIFFILSVLTHTTALVGIILLPLIYKFNFSLKRTNLLLIASLLIAFSGILQLDELLKYIFDLFSGYTYITRYSGYQDQMAEFDSFYFLIKKLLPLTFITTFLIFNCKSDKVLGNFYVKLALSYVILNNLMVYSLYTFRILLYLAVFWGIGISILLSNQKNIKLSMKVFLFFVFLQFWMIHNDLNNQLDVYSYNSYLL